MQTSSLGKWIQKSVLLFSFESRLFEEPMEVEFEVIDILGQIVFEFRELTLLRLFRLSFCLTDQNQPQCQRYDHRFVKIHYTFSKKLNEKCVKKKQKLKHFEEYLAFVNI